MLRFYLKQIQDFTQATSLGKGEELKFNDWLKKYLSENATAKLIPKELYTLSYKLNQEDPPPKKGKRELQPKHQRFVLPLRKGWVKARTASSRVTWDAYRNQVPSIPVSDDDHRVITPDKAETELLEMGILRWRWGGVKLKGGFQERLERLVVREGQTWNHGQDFLKKVRHVIVQRVASQEPQAEEIWKIQFVLR
jgi:hypothetical protein